MGAEIEGTVPREDSPTSSGWIATRIAKFEFRSHGWFERLRDGMDQLKAGLTAHMQENERGPRDYAPNTEEIEDRVDRRMRHRLRDLEVSIHNGGPKNTGQQSWQTWVLTIVGLLIVSGIGGVIYQLSDLKGDMRAFLKGQELDEKRIDNLEKHVYRGTD